MCNAKFALVGIAASLLLTMGASRTARAAGSAHCSSSAKITTRVARRHAAFLWKSCYDGPDTNKCAQGFVGVNCSSENLSLALYDDFQEAAKKDILMTRHDGQSLFNRTYETRACTKKKISCLEIDKEGHWKVEKKRDDGCMTTFRRFRPTDDCLGEHFRLCAFRLDIKKAFIVGFAANGTQVSYPVNASKCEIDGTSLILDIAAGANDTTDSTTIFHEGYLTYKLIKYNDNGQ